MTVAVSATLYRRCCHTPELAGSKKLPATGGVDVTLGVMSRFVEDVRRAVARGIFFRPRPVCSSGASKPSSQSIPVHRPASPANHVHCAANQRRFLTASKLWMLLAGTTRRAEGLISGTGAAPRIDLAARAAIRVAKPSPVTAVRRHRSTARQPRLKSPA
jgi:hypothetical protein